MRMTINGRPRTGGHQCHGDRSPVDLLDPGGAACPSNARVTQARRRVRRLASAHCAEGGDDENVTEPILHECEVANRADKQAVRLRPQVNTRPSHKRPGKPVVSRGHCVDSHTLTEACGVEHRSTDNAGA